MHDTFLNERIYEGLLKLCRENRISRVKKVSITVNTDSHISEKSLHELFSERNSHILGEWTEVTVEKQGVGRLNGVINSIEGESLDE